jgi:hypothetical protein
VARLCRTHLVAVIVSLKRLTPMANEDEEVVPVAEETG